TLRIFADTRYMLWINGSYVERGPCRFDPKLPEYDILDVAQFLNKGKNVIAVLVHHYAIKKFTEWFLQCARIMEHAPGLVVRLDVQSSQNNSLTLFTDTTWKVSTKTRYLPSPGTYSSIFDNIDCRLDNGDWSGADFDDSAWANAVPVDGNLWGRMHPRSIPLLQENTIIPNSIVQAKINGIVTNKIKTLSEHLPVTMGKDDKIIIDAGHVVQGYSILDFSADEGSTLEVEYASRFFDTGNTPDIVMFGMDTHPRSNRYIAKSGRQTYIGGDTYGFKYLIFRVRNGSVTLNNIKVVNRLYPLTRLGKFTSNDTLLNKIWDICVNTVEVCSEDAFVDCADRERAQWIADGYLINYPVSRSALATAGGEKGYVYCDHRLLKNMLRHMGLSQLPDGRLQPMRPSNYPPNLTHGVIDDYSCLWVQGLRELYDRSGDETVVYELWQTVVNAMNYFLNRRSERGLIEAMEFIYFNNPLIYKVCEGASINAFIYRSLIDAAYLGTIVNDTKNAKYFSEAAELLNQNYNKTLWNENAGSYYGSISQGQKTPSTGHAAVLALFYNMVPQNKYNRVMNYMIETCEKENPFPLPTALSLRFSTGKILPKWTNVY
ncbi:MAG: alpha-L-rhamnosidase N-terminal domain-containing protein, partial [Patescibacteria group bacterium]|nr:alpha-L-rhamnosidase N-terminal domain-containing protein [Patescibacteria group bacterium]